MSERLDQLMKLHAGDPADAFCTYAIALEHAKAGQRDLAITWLDKTLALDPHYFYASFQKAKLLAESSSPQDLALARNILTAATQSAQRAGDAHAASELSALLESL